MAPAAMLDVVVAEALWVRPYPVRLAGATFGARMTVIRLGGGEIIIHSPCPFDPPLAAAIAELGPVAAIIAPGNLHWLHVRSCQQAFPEARTFVCPGVERRAQSLAFDGVLGDEAPPLWAGQLSQVALQGTGLVREVAFFHRRSRTLILVDLIENFTPATPGTNLFSRMIFRALGMWGRPAPAPEYRFAWGDRARVREGLRRILAWDFERVILSHGDLIRHDARNVVQRAWRSVLS